MEWEGAVVLTPAILKRGALAAAIGSAAPTVREARALFAGRTKSGFMYLVMTPPRRGGLAVDADAVVEDEPVADPLRGGDEVGARESDDIIFDNGFAMLGEMPLLAICRRLIRSWLKLES